MKNSQFTSILISLIILTSISCSNSESQKARVTGPWGAHEYVNDRGVFNFIDKHGNIVIYDLDISLPYFDPQLEFCEGLAVAEKQNSFGYVDQKGNWVIPAQYEMAGNFSEGLAVVRLRSNEWQKQWAYIDKTGQIVIGPQKVSSFQCFSEGLAAVCMNDKTRDSYQFIDKNGEPAMEATFDHDNNSYYNSYMFSEGLASAYKEGEGWGFIDKSGNFIINPQFDGATMFVEGYAPVRIGHKWGLIDKRGKLVVSPLFPTPRYFSEGLLAVDDGYIDTKGKKVILSDYICEEPFSHGLAAVSTEDGNWGFMNTKGEIVFTPNQLSDESDRGGYEYKLCMTTLDGHSYFKGFNSDGLAKILKISNRLEGYYYINCNGTVIYHKEYEN